MNTTFEATESVATLPGAARRQGASEIARQALLWGPAAAVLAFAGAAMLVPDGPTLQDSAVAQVVFLAVCLAWLLPRAASRLHRLVRASADGAIDRRTGFYNRDGFIDAADDMLSRAQAEGRSLSVLVIEFNDLREVHEIYGPAISRRLIAKLVRKLGGLAGAHGLAGRTGPAQFTVVLPMPRGKALRAVQRVLGKPARIEFDAGDSEIVLVPDLLLDCSDGGTQDMEALCREMSNELARMQKDELRRQQYLQRSRERHSRPMSLHSRP